MISLIDSLRTELNNDEMTDDTLTTDNELIALILQGEKERYGTIVRRYNQRMYRVAISILNDENEVEDAMQVAYINAFENLKNFVFKSSFSTWLTRILINECLARLKKRARTIVMNDNNIENAMLYRQAIDTQTPVTKVLNSELRVVLDDAIRKLPEPYRAVFVMREIENMNVAETQECLSLSEVNVKVRLNRAKAMLRNLLSGYYQKEDLLHFHLTRCDRITNAVLAAIENL